MLAPLLACLGVLVLPATLAQPPRTEDPPTPTTTLARPPAIDVLLDDIGVDLDGNVDGRGRLDLGCARARIVAQRALDGRKRDTGRLDRWQWTWWDSYAEQRYDLVFTDVATTWTVSVPVRDCDGQSLNRLTRLLAAGLVGAA